MKSENKRGVIARAFPLKSIREKPVAIFRFVFMGNLQLKTMLKIAADNTWHFFTGIVLAMTSLFCLKSKFNLLHRHKRTVFFVRYSSQPFTFASIALLKTIPTSSSPLKM